MVAKRRLTPILEMARSTYPRISGQLALAPIPGFCAVEFRQIMQGEAVAPGPIDGNNAREWAWRPGTSGRAPGGRPAIGAFHPYEDAGKTSVEVRITTKRRFWTDRDILFRIQGW